ncbi:MAG: dihydroorotate dehydrogenase electron transfer subunit [Gammaproteobacteria bacterium]|nr:dihydroorotate dehydrogenase electron transfer subunit [Gammaproteobacteria bacterium]
MSDPATVAPPKIVESVGVVLANDAYAGGQYILRLQAPEIAARAVPGSFVHLRCAPELPLRRPLSIMLRDQTKGWIDILYKVVGRGTAALAERQVGQQLPLLGPIGNGFSPAPRGSRPVLIGGGVGMPPMLLLASELRREPHFRPVLFLGSEVPFPFAPKPSEFMLDGLPPGVLATMPLLDDWGIPARLASGQGFAGCFDGLVTDLARAWLAQLDETARQSVHLYACGPTPMLRAVAELARGFDLPCQVSLEEHMACAIGGCAGCVVQVATPTGPAMKRVCVDGPVFDASTVF